MARNKGISAAKAKKPIFKRWWFWVIVALVAIFAIVPSGKNNDTDKKDVDSTAASTEAPTPEPTKEPAEEPTKEPTREERLASLISYGDVLSCNFYDDYDPKRIVIKMKIHSQTSNKLTINQNYHNINDIAQDGAYNDYLIDYWAVADMADGSESKVISFEVPSDIMKALEKQTVVPINLEPHLDNLWILPSLKR